MKKIITESLKELIRDRYLLFLLSFLILLSIILSIAIGFAIRPSELQLVSHYTAFGITHLYRDQWFYLLNFVAFELIVAVLHSVISIKLSITKGRPLAIAFAWLGVVIVILGWVMAMALLNVWKPS